MTTVRTWERIHLIVRHRTRLFGSSTGGPSSKLDALRQVITHFPGSAAKETELCQYCHCTPSTSKFPKSICGKGTTTAETPKVIPPPQIIQV